MEEFAERSVAFLLHCWQNATMFHYLQLALAIVIMGWYVRRHSSG